jgi:hypothetical protein
MSTPVVPEFARLVLSVLCPDENILPALKPVLQTGLGPIEEEIGPLDFPFTSYYDREMGPGIRRWLWVFEHLLDRSRLASVKCLTNRIEQTYTIDGKRIFNLDPGFMTLGNFVLATGKNNAHRIYLQDGIFADLTLIYRSGSYHPLEWTYPDYADNGLISILNQLREQYKCRLTEPACPLAPLRA